MVKVTNIFGDVYSGQAGKAGVFAKWKGRQYRRKYVVPANPNTAMQQAVRASFTNAVDKWHDFLSPMRSAYGYMATGLTMSGFNLHVSRWQKMTVEQRSAYVDPYTGWKQIGSNDLTAIVQIPTVVSQAEYTTTEIPLGLGQTEYTAGTSGVDLHAIVEVNRGRVNVLQNITGALKISYTAQGRTVTDEVLATDPTADTVLYTAYYPIDYQSVTVKEVATEIDALEVNVKTGKFYFTDTLPSDTSGAIDSKDYIAVSGVKLEVKKVDTSFVTWRGYTDDDGIIESAQTSEDGNRDSRIEKAGYQPVIVANITAQAAAIDAYQKVIAL